MATNGKLRVLGNALAALLFLVVLGWTVHRASQKPVYNWDMLGYMALALEWELDDPEEIHRRTYGAAQERLPQRVYQGMILGGVRAARYQDPAAFQEHIAFYRGRVLYTLTLSALHRIGAPLADATWWVSLVSFGLLGLLILAWTSRHLPFLVAVPVSLALTHAPYLLDARPPGAGLAAYSTPDALAAFVTCAGVFVLAELRRARWAAAILTVAVLARPDTVILVGVLIAVLFLGDEHDERPGPAFAGTWVGAAAATYLAVRAFSGHYGWWPLFWISFVRKEVHPSEISTSFDPGTYWGVLSEQVGSFLGSQVFVYVGIVLAALVLWNRAPYRPRASRSVLVLIALLVTFLVRFLLFPQLWDRFFAPFYVLVPLLCLTLLGAYLRPSDEGARARA